MCISAHSAQQVAPLYFTATHGKDKPTRQTHTKSTAAPMRISAHSAHQVAPFTATTHNTKTNPPSQPARTLLHTRIIQIPLDICETMQGHENLPPSEGCVPLLPPIPAIPGSHCEGNWDSSRGCLCRLQHGKHCHISGNVLDTAGHTSW